jgi:hypothetical protein
VLSPLVSIESEKMAVRDFHYAVKSGAKSQAFLPLPIGRPSPNTDAVDTNNSEFTVHREIEIKESKTKLKADKSPMKKTPWILPLPKSGVPDQKPFSMVPQNIHIEAPRTSIVLDASPLS